MEISSSVSNKIPDIHNICRICLQRNENATNLFSNYEESKVILDKIYLCFQIIFSQEDYLPSVICSNCIEELNMANKFRIKCISFEERFSTFCSMMTERIQANSEKDLSNNCISLEPSENGDDKIESANIKCEADLACKEKNKICTVRKLTKTFVCDICNKVLKTKASLLKHNISMHVRRKHVGKITGSGHDRPYLCTHCPYSTPHSQTLVNHMRRHNGTRPFSCECGKSFTQAASLSAHRKTHSDITYYTCATCGKQFKHAFTLKNHQRVHELGNFTCSICQKILKSQQSLQEHMHRHYNVRNYNCEDCGATFVTCSDLISHRKKHDTEKKAKCHLCDYKTYAKKNLILHLKRHSGEKSIKCDLCAVTVYTRSELRRHQRVHSREKPFPCPACAQRFSYSPSLNKHVRNIHGTPYKWGDSKTIQTKKNTVKDENLFENEIKQIN